MRHASGLRPALRDAHVLLALALALAVGMAAADSPRTAPEYSVKAAYLLLFTRYVTWPDSVFPSPAAPLQVCMLGKDPFGRVLDETFKDAQAQGRPLKVRRVAGPGETQGCHLAFLGGREGAHLDGWLPALQARPVLTVAEAEGSEGPVVAFAMEGKKLRYDVDLAAADRAGLRIAAPMLVSARKIRPSEGKQAP